MSEQVRILQLLEEALHSGRTPEEVCVDSPDLLPAVRARWEHCRRLDAHLANLFPSALSSAGREGGDFSVGEGTPYRVELPSIPGYAVETVLGRGGVGVVFGARHLRLRRRVALKMLLTGVYASPVERARFLREAQAVAALRHAHVVQVHDVGEHEGRPYFTMELMDGGSLAERLGGIPRPPVEAATLIIAIAGAVHDAHRAGIVHRDLKPANVLLSADGTPKVSDFGLALQAAGEGEEELGLTLSGARIGTPSYMAPEQAAGRHSEVGPAADIYALGAILYEMLTGRPPFRGESAAETERQVIAEDPVQPSRLNARVPRDLETICLKCLRKDSRRRYGSASDLADDLRRFQRGEPISARRTGQVERAAKWVKRRPAIAVALATGGLLAISLTGGSLWIISQRAAVNKAVAEDLQEVVRQQKQSNWMLANAALDKATFRLGGSGPGELRRSLDQARRDSMLVKRLERIRMEEAETLGGSFPVEQIDKDYVEVFGGAGLGTGQENPEAFAARVRNSNIQAALVGALDHWNSFTVPTARKEWISEVVRLADHDPAGLRDRIRSSAVWNNGPALTKLLDDATLEGISNEPATFLLAVANRMRSLGQNDGPFSLRIQQSHPSDFYINLWLGCEMAEMKNVPAELAYFQAATAVRPDVAFGHHNLGVALNAAGRIDESIVQYRQANECDPNNVTTHYNLGANLARTGHSDEAIREFEAAIHCRSEQQLPYVSLGVVLSEAGRYPEALVRTRQALALKPTGSLLASARLSMRVILIRMGKKDEALQAWKKQLQELPYDPDFWDGYAEYAIFLGRDDEYRQARKSLLDQFGESTDPRKCELTARACLLMPASGDELRRATAMINRALAADPAKYGKFFRYFRFTKGLADYRAGNFTSALSVMTGNTSKVLKPAPGLVAAMAQYQLGQRDVARQTLALAIQQFDWEKVPDIDAEDWIFHVLRREAEATILPGAAHAP